VESGKFVGAVLTAKEFKVKTENSMASKRFPLVPCTCSILYLF